MTFDLWILNSFNQWVKIATYKREINAIKEFHKNFMGFSGKILKSGTIEKGNLKESDLK